MVNQYAGVDLGKEPTRFDFVADRFENIPIYFQTYFGSTHVDDVTTMIDYAIYTHDVGHVVIDNLQFMLSGQGRGIDRFEMQDQVVAKLRKLATSHNVHITLVIHPRKGEDGADLSLSSIFGTAKSTQEADNVMILQQREKYRVIDIKKNRYDGEIGRSSLWFDKNSKRFEQISAKEIEELLTGAKLSDVLERKGREVNLDALAYQSDDAIDERLPVPVLTQKPSSIVMDENLKKILAKRSAPDGMKDYHKAFSRLDEFKSASLRKTHQEPIHHESPLSVDDYYHEEDYGSGNIKITIPKEESTSRAPDSDPFDVKFEGKYEEIGISAKFSDLSSKNESSKQVPRQREPSEDQGNPIDDPFEPKVTSEMLGGLGEEIKIQTLDSMYKEETLFTYNDLLEEYANKGEKKKYQTKYKRQQNSNIEYKTSTSEKSSSGKNKK